MKLLSAHIEDLKTLYINELKKALDLERKIVKALPEMIEAAEDTQLASAFRTHLEETRGHASQVDSLLARHTGDVDTETCKVIDALASEASDTIKDVTNPDVRNIALIGAAQQVEHHEIAVYGTLRNWAEVLGLPDDAAILESIEADEINTDEILTQLSESLNTVSA